MNEDRRADHDRALHRATLALLVIVFALLLVIVARQGQLADEHDQERELVRQVRELRDLAEAGAAAARYSGLTVELELVEGDQVRRAAVQVENGEPVSSWQRKLREGARGLEEIK